ncbi:MAG: HIT family protein, partial [Nanoarchaeota archaeon]
MSNDYLDIIGRKKDAKIIYEDDKALAFLPEQASVPGEIVITPKKPYQIMEQLPDDLIVHLSVLARKLSDRAFELLSGKGTNILIQNGVPAGQDVPQFSIRILPRKEGDSVNFTWQTEREEESELDSAHNILGEETKNIFISAMETKHKPIEEKPKQKEIVSEEGEIDYRLDFL